MTYCVGIAVTDGIVMVSDSRTNAGADNISAYSKMRRYGIAGQCQFVITSAGNLATTQTLYAAIDREIREAVSSNLLESRSVEDAANHIGNLSREAQAKGTGGGSMYEASFLIAGEVRGESAQLMLVYPQGNHIASGNQTPYLQIGESKYGEPILDRVLSMATSLDKAALCALVSMDATMRSNVTVAPPIELYVYTAGSLAPGLHQSFGEGSAYLADIKRRWDALVLESFGSLPPVPWHNPANSS